MTEDPRQDALLEVLALLLQGRPEWVTTFLLGSQDAEVRGAAGHLAELLSTLAIALPPSPPRLDAEGHDPLRTRILSSLASRHVPRSALLVVDMQNDHLRPGSPVEVPRARDIVPAVAARLEQARAEGVPVVYVVDQHELDDPELDLWPLHNIVGSEGAKVWPGLEPRDGDRVVSKSTYSAFTGSKLETVLDELGVDTLVLTGCVTEAGLFATAVDALQRGYSVVVPPDAQAGAGEIPERVALGSLSLMPPYAPARRRRIAKARAAMRATLPSAE